MTIIELHRTFELAGDDPAETDRALMRAFAHMTAQKLTGWPEILQLSRVILLGEAGSGKTQELRFRSEQLRKAGKFAWFGRIEDIADGPFIDSIETSLAKESFKAWHRGADTGYLFLDSVDESRLRGLSFRRLLYSVAEAIRGASDRVRIVISCRVSDWQSSSDRDLVGEILAVSSPERGAAPGETQAEEQKKSDPRPSVYILSPLDEHQVKALAGECCGVEDPEKLWQSIKDAQLEAFAARPRDVAWLAQYWRDRGCFGSLSEMVEENISKRLLEANYTHVRRRDITPSRARDGAVSLAGATALCRELAIFAPDRDALAPHPSGALDPDDLLPDWHADERNALLSRAIFNPATYGRIRFHHRTVAEYLGAKWLNRMLEDVPPSEVERLIVVHSCGYSFIDDALAPAAAWLAQWRTDIRRTIRAIQPEVLIQYGDPGSLPDDERLEILRDFLNILAAGEPSRESITFEALDRFTTRGFGNAIATLIQDYREQPDALVLLMRVCQHSNLEACTDQVYDVAISAGPARLYAISALARIGGKGRVCRLAEHMLSNAGEVRPSELEFALRAVCEFGEIHLAIRILRLLEEKRAARISLSEYQLKKIVNEEIGIDLLLPLARDILSEVTALYAGDAERRGFNKKALLRVSFAILAINRFLGHVVMKDGQTIRQVGELIEEAEKALRIQGRFQDFSFVSASISLHSELVSFLFWRAAANELSARGRYPDDAGWLYNFETLWSIEARDFDWLLDDARSYPTATGRALAASAAYRALSTADAVEQIRWAVADEPRALEALENHLRPRASALTERQRRFERKQSQREERERVVREGSKAELLKNIEEIRAGRATSALIYIWRNAYDDTRHKWSEVNYSKLEADFGCLIAEAARSGFVAYWRNFHPPALDRKDPGSVPWEIVLGLCGISAELDGVEDHLPLSGEEATVAAQYAVWEMNGFPSWFEILASTFPASARQSLAREVDADFNELKGREDSVRVVHRMRDMPSMLHAIGIDILAQRLEIGDPGTKLVLSETLRCISDTLRAPSAAMASARSHAARGTDLEWLWWAAWFNAAEDDALRDIEMRSSEGEEADRVRIAQGLASLFPYIGDPTHVRLSSPEAAGRLYRLLRAVPVEDAPTEEGDEGGWAGDRSGTPRAARDAILRRLAQNDGLRAYYALSDLVPDAVSDEEKTWLLRLARDAARRAAQRETWTARQFAHYDKQHWLEPKSSDQLFQTVQRRIEQYKDEAERHDFGGTKRFSSFPDEYDVQKDLGLWLEKNSKGEFNVDREPQVRDDKRVDIRIRRTGVAGVVTIEVKRAEAWTLNGLKAKLESQLVELYMKPHTSRHGVFFVAQMVDPFNWKDEKTNNVTFGQGIDDLEACAASILRRRPDVRALAVVGVDMHDLVRDKPKMKGPRRSRTAP